MAMDIKDTNEISGMTLEQRADYAADLRATGTCNCSQAVLRAFEDKLPFDDRTAMEVSAGFGAGMGCMEATCGALVGAVMVAGVLTGGQRTPLVARQMLGTFREDCGATICRELKGVGTGRVLCPCADCVRNAVLGMGQVLPVA